MFFLLVLLLSDWMFCDVAACGLDFLRLLLFGIGSCWFWKFRTGCYWFLCFRIVFQWCCDFGLGFFCCSVDVGLDFIALDDFLFIIVWDVCDPSCFLNVFLWFLIWELVFLISDMMLVMLMISDLLFNDFACFGFPFFDFADLCCCCLFFFFLISDRAFNDVVESGRDFFDFDDFGLHFNDLYDFVSDL